MSLGGSGVSIGGVGSLREVVYPPSSLPLKMVAPGFQEIPIGKHNF